MTNVSIDPDLGGATYVEGGIPTHILAAGYLGSTFFGGVLIMSGFDTLVSKVMSFIIGLGLLLPLVLVRDKLCVLLALFIFHSSTFHLSIFLSEFVSVLTNPMVIPDSLPSYLRLLPYYRVHTRSFYLTFSPRFSHSRNPICTQPHTFILSYKITTRPFSPFDIFFPYNSS